MSLEKSHKRIFLPSRPSSSSSSTMKKIKNGSVVKKCSSARPKKIRKSQVIKTFSIMEQEKSQQQQNPSETSGTNEDEKNDFFNTGRIGRRNAMPDILGNNCTASSGGDLPLKLSALTTNESSSTSQQTTTETPSQQTTTKK